MKAALRARWWLAPCAVVAIAVAGGAVYGVGGSNRGSGSAGPDGKRAKGITWQLSLPDAVREAKRTGKPIMVDFYATWCPPCKMLSERTWTDPTVIAESRKWVAVKVDVDQHQDQAGRYGIQSLPTVAFLKTDGQVVTGFEGFREPDETLKLMQTAYDRVR